MRRTTSSWLSTIAKLGFRKRTCHRSVGRHRVFGGYSRRLAAEMLEDRCMLVVGAIAPNPVSFGEFEGVARLDLVHDGQTESEALTCSGALLATGKHILTANHCVTTSGIEDIDESLSHVEFFVGDLSTPITYTIESITPYPGFTTNYKELGGDIAIIELTDIVDPAISRYDIYRDSDEIGQVFVRVGYGNTGTGASGQIQPSDPLSNSDYLKHSGMNRFDDEASVLNDYQNELGQLFEIPNQAYTENVYLISDFDNGTSAKDALGQYLGVADQGLAGYEAAPGGGDSGGPLFVNGQVAGVTSHGRLFADVTPSYDSTQFGAIDFDTRVSYYQDWIDSVIDVGGNSTADALAVPLGFDAGEMTDYEITGAISGGDAVDYYELNLKPGDILGVAVVGGVDWLKIYSSIDTEHELLGVAENIVDASSPLPRGDLALAWIVDAEGTYYVSTEGGSGAYELDLAIHRPVLESQEIGAHQILYLDFEVGDIDLSPISGAEYSDAELTPLSSFLTNWQLSTSDEDDLISAIVAVVQENLATDIRLNGTNGDYFGANPQTPSGAPGEFGIEILNSRDHSELISSLDNVSRVFVGGTVGQAGIAKVGKGQHDDLGNFDTQDIAVVTLEFLSDPSGSYSLNQFEITKLDGESDEDAKIRLVAEGVGNIISHEVGHLFGLRHTLTNIDALQSPYIQTPPYLNDRSGDQVDNILGIELGGTVWTDTPELPNNVGFGPDLYYGDTISGTQNSVGVISHVLSTGTYAGPQVTSVTIGSTNSTHEAYDFADTSVSVGARVGSGEQLKTVPVGQANTIEVTFSRDVVITANDISLIGVSDGSVVDYTSQLGFSYDDGAATLTFDDGNSSFPADQMVLTISDSVYDPVTLLALDGDWLNPESISTAMGNSSTFPSGDGVTGGDFQFNFTILPADFNRYGIVDVADLGILSTQYGSYFGGFSFRQGDATGEGTVDVGDLAVLNLLYKTDPDDGRPDFTSWPILVTTGADEDGLNPNATSLREAFDLAANELVRPGKDVIVLAPWIDEIDLSGELLIDSDVDIYGTGWQNQSIKAQAASGNRVFNVTSNVNAMIHGIKIAGGNVVGGPGGGIYSVGNLTLDEVWITGNSASGSGGYGGGIYQWGGSLSIDGSEIDANGAVSGAGVMAINVGNLVVSSSAIVENDSVGGSGGGLAIANVAYAIVKNTTIGDNTALLDGGGVYVINSTATFVNDTIAKNESTGGGGGGIYVMSGTVVIHNSIVVDNEATYESDISGFLDGNSSHNLLRTGSTGGLTAGNVVLSLMEVSGLSSLAYNGLLTQHYRLLSTSKAIDAGDNAVALMYGLDEDDKDQRGENRIVDWQDDDEFDLIDIGAVELAVGEMYS